MAVDAEPLDRTTFHLRSGRTVELVALDQFPTYEGLLIGVPTRRMNQEKMDRLVARYLDPGRYGVPLLLTPEQRPADGSAPATGDGATTTGADAAAVLSPVTCVARFISSGLSGSNDIWSILRLIWFQDSFAFPIDPRVREQIAGLDWDAHAMPWEP